ncbi:adenosylmethionine--8-amino-7-oxononanoate transaminase [Cryobacterium sp. PH31-O1]|uniref:adenosylmethionine--8-amino-7-oxononanoate transaminase n=1 Tax=Cryobacterium sp. PH31-O1 TaxID=3046306 RepID=UPI0024BB2C26|nr:adenosylmethionine--8-amino-7-oxononanoate transaminase [Cryobacterium sp. PH31-O1]MDJ0339570.1 adenosylmethionine--8-amino-7-oxononanoate transaminase [Cryobacterium sp. PH31-O1]
MSRAGTRTPFDRDRAALWHPYASAGSPEPLWQVEAAEGVRLRLRGEDGAGSDVIDGMASWWCMIHGYRNPVLDAALTEQAGQFSHVMFGGLTHAPAIELAELLVSITPEGLERVFFADSGSVCVEVALKLAVQYQGAGGRPQRQRMLTVSGGYHGDTFGAMGVCDPVDGMHSTFAGLLPNNIFAPRPPSAATATPQEIAVWARAVAALAADNSDELAAIILEPVLQGAGGMFVYPPECLRALRRIADDHGLLLILDEIATGFGRTGELFAADHAGVRADIMCVGKALTGGYLTLAAMLCTNRVARTVSHGAAGALLHGPTFMANPLACAVALASVRLLLAADWRGNVAGINTALTLGLSPARELDVVASVRTLGAVGVIELDRPVDVAEVTRAAMRNGVWIRPFRNLVYTMPPYVCTGADLAVLTRGMVAAVAEVYGDTPGAPMTGEGQ